MKGINLKDIANLGKLGLRAMNQNLPTILSGFAIAGVIATAWATYKAAPDVKSAIEGAKWNKANKPVEDEDEDETVEVDDVPDMDDVKLNTWETVTAVAPYVWKPVACGAFTIGCIAGAQVLNVQRLTMLAGAYKLSENKLKEYEAKAREFLGEEKAAEVDKVVAEEQIQVVLRNGTVIETPNKGWVCFDPWSGRCFTSNEATLRRAESFVNRTIMCGEFVSLNDFYDELSLKHTKPGQGFGWGDPCGHHRFGDMPMELRFNPVAMDVDGEQKVVYVLDYGADFIQEYF